MRVTNLGAASALEPTRPVFLSRNTADERLVALVRQGNATAFEALYDRYHERILSFCRHTLGSLPDGEDATQHAFVALHRHLVHDERPIDVKPWLFRVARNRCLSLLRARREHADVAAAEPATAGLADEVLRRDDLRELLGDLRELPEDQRSALLLSSLGDLTGEQIAEVVGCRPQKVKALVFQARTTLMNARQARDTDCRAIREELSTLRGGALLRGHLRRHVRGCEGCRAFRAELKHQRAAMAVLLPVLPTAGLKAATMSAALGGSAATAGAGAAGGGIAAGLATVGKAGAAKVLLAAAVAGGGVGAGIAEVKHLRADDPSPAPAHRTTAPGARHDGAAGRAPSTDGRPAHHGRPAGSPAHSSNAATGKGIAGTQHGTTGKAGAPGQLKPHHAPAPPEHAAKTHKPKPVAPSNRPTAPPGSLKTKPARPVHTEPTAPADANAPADSTAPTTDAPVAPVAPLAHGLGHAKQ